MVCLGTALLEDITVGSVRKQLVTVVKAVRRAAAAHRATITDFMKLLLLAVTWSWTAIGSRPGDLELRSHCFQDWGLGSPQILTRSCWASRQNWWVVVMVQRYFRE